MNKPICEKCVQKGKKYSVTEPLGGFTTLMGISPGYWNEEGEYIPPYNPNYTTYTYNCSNGHSWNKVEKYV